MKAKIVRLVNGEISTEDVDMSGVLSFQFFPKYGCKVDVSKSDSGEGIRIATDGPVGILCKASNVLIAYDANKVGW